ncbi:uncharacterized protein At2g29880-like [Magnolia sinica]|uniref:uncharacterized protein At2g29880-like n=1 Tax=Magnolia sinica TaxID=86752 RepID=UPI00265A0340|nr:uncharacterized protein At2g29880-like [Magnolia sinica]
MDNALVDALVEQVNLGRKSDMGFKPETYKATITEMFNRCGVELENRYISNRLRTLKRFYWAVKNILNASGFGWDADLKMVVTMDNVWSIYIESHPYAQRVRGKHIDRYNDLTYMFGNDCAHGSYASTAYSSPLFGRRRGRDDLDSDEYSDDNGTETVHLFSNEDGDDDSGPTIHPNEGSHQRQKRVNTGSMET